MDKTGPARGAVTVAALGVVFGDIGTSPLYAMRECFVGVAGFPVDHANVFGILSLITWSLVVVVTLKYIGVVLRADNQGEGGILALAHLVVPDDIEDWRRRHWALVGIGLIGAGLLFGDGIITPALSVLSALEGLTVAAPALRPLVVPLTLGILIGLFAIQRFGTGRVGAIFGPVMLLWFGTLGLLGVSQIVGHPQVLNGLDPRHAVAFFAAHGLHGTLILGAVFLAVTGAEAMYADLGHFGRAPIQRAWLGLVFPALLLNYFGQGALLLQHPELVEEVFFRLAPEWALFPLVVLATLATIIASQAVISGVFSLTAQAVQLQYFPRTRILHTSPEHRGQIYVPAANRFLLFGTLLLVLGFRSSGGLADAYGIAVSLTMVLTAVLLFFVMRERWHVPAWVALPVTAALLAVDMAFFLAIARKVMSGGWIPLSIALLLVLVMSVWRRGRQLLHRHHPRVDPQDLPARDRRLVFLVRDADHQPVDPALRPDAIYVHIKQCHRPYMRNMAHGEVFDRDGRTVVQGCFGFMEQPDVPRLLATLGTEHNLGPTQDVTYVVVHETLGTDDDRGMPRLFKQIYGMLTVRAARVSDAYGLPADRVLELHPQIRP
jgi:KUP system potassium uptake protein